MEKWIKIKNLAIKYFKTIIVSLYGFAIRPKNRFSRIVQKIFIIYVLLIIVTGLLPGSWKKNIAVVLEKTVILRPLSRLFFLSVIGDNSIDLDILNVKAIKAYPEKKTPTLSAIGSIDFFEKVDVVSKTSGNIQKLFVKEGDDVIPGQILVQMETLQLELEQKKNSAQLESARSSLRLAEEKYEKAKSAVEIRVMEVEKRRTQVKELKAELDKIRATFTGKQALYQESGVSKEEFGVVKTAVISAEAKFLLAKKDLEISQIGFRDEDLKNRKMVIPKDPQKRSEAFVLLNTRIEKAEMEVAVSQLNSAKAALDSTQELLRTTTIRSPINGVVAFRNKHVGEFVNQGSVTSSEQAIMVLVNINSVYAKMNVRESELKTIRRGMPLEFTVDVYPSEKFQGNVTIINPIVDPKTHTAEVKALLKNPENKLKPGMFLRGILVTGKPEFVMLLLSSSITPKEGENAWVFVIKNNLILKSEVKTGRTYDDKIEIRSGLEP
ncbi:MAG: efflux RND transporter periplasmic adaptor subunit, partial [Leptospira sp.]|nr:efflux RND transporter periplasmic adaptor subunit [Leptospira sp.]